jgi:hypothetical protein
MPHYKPICHWWRPLPVRGMLLAVAVAAVALPSPAVPAQAQALCGTFPASAPPQHVLIVMLENRTYNKVIGNSAAPFENSLVKSCGAATSM